MIASRANEILAFVGLLGWGFLSAGVMLPARHEVTAWCGMIGAVLMAVALFGCMATQIVR